MKEIVEEILASQGYRKIKTNIDYVILYVKYADNAAWAVQLFDCVDSMRVSAKQLFAFDKKAEEYLKSKVDGDVNLINIIATRFMKEAREMNLVINRCWVIDCNSYRLIKYENQPKDFDGLNSIIAVKLYSLVPPNDSDIYGYELDDSVPDSGNSYYYEDNTCVVKEAINIDDFSEKGFMRMSSIYIGNSRITLVNTIIVAINVLVFLVMNILGDVEDGRYLVYKGAMYAPLISEGEIYRLFTCMFIHGGLQHILSNMLFLLSLGDNVERAVGWFRYLLIYIGGGLLGSFASYLFASAFNPNVPSVGASGAIFAIVGALLWLVAKNGGQLEDLTTVKIAILIIYSLYSGFMSKNVDNAAHVGGLVGGFAIAALLTLPRKHHRKD